MDGDYGSYGDVHKGFGWEKWKKEVTFILERTWQDNFKMDLK